MANKKALTINIILVFLLSLVFAVIKADAQKACQTDYDCRSDGDYSCGQPVDPRTSSRISCCCYKEQCVQYYAMSKIIQAENWPIRDCQLKFDSTSARNMCIRAVARSKKDYLLCKQISDSTNLNACIRDVAREIQDVSLCKHINDEWQHGLCVVGIARDAQDTRLCQSLTGQSREYCFSEVAEATSDLKLCDESGGYKSGCIDTIKKKTRDVNEKKITKDVAIEIAKRRLQKESFANDIDFGKFTVHFREKTNDYVVDFACKGCNEIFPGLWSGGYSVAVDANTGNIKEGGFGPYKR